MTIPTPRFYEYLNKTFRIVDAGGKSVGEVLDIATGRFERDDRPITRVLSATTESDIGPVDEDEFIQLTEIARARYLRGEGPIFALYDTIDGLYEQAKAGGQGLGREEQGLIKSLRRRTYRMWEDEFARIDAGEAPANPFASIIAR
jgi:hypothetical protein